jgi:hypothetical protein
LVKPLISGMKISPSISINLFGFYIGRNLFHPVS